MTDDIKKGHHARDHAQAEDDESYDVGYGKPPKHTQFAKGKSGNPRGRPKKKDKRPIRFSDAMSERFLEEEAYRTVTLKENGQAISLPVTQAVQRSLATKAMMGGRLQQKLWLDLVKHSEEMNYQAKLDRYIRLQKLKLDGEEQIELHKSKNLPPPELLPHPEDIVLDPVSGEAYINGPMTREELKCYEQSVQLRDHLLLRSAHATKIRKTPSAHHEGEGVCYYMVLAHFLDRFLPARYRWKEIDAISLMMDYECMTKIARQRLITSESARLESEWIPFRGMTPEVQEILDQVRRRFLGNAA